MKLLGYLTGSVVACLMVAYTFFADGFMLSKLWEWYAVPLGMRPLHWHVFAVAVGAWQCVRYRSNGQEDNRSEATQAAAFVVALAFPWIVLLIGWWWL